MKKLLSLGLVTAMLLASVEFAFPQGSVYAEEVGDTQEISEVTLKTVGGGAQVEETTDAKMPYLKERFL